MRGWKRLARHNTIQILGWPLIPGHYQGFSRAMQQSLKLSPRSLWKPFGPSVDCLSGSPFTERVSIRESQRTITEGIMSDLPPDHFAIAPTLCLQSQTQGSQTELPQSHKSRDLHCQLWDSLQYSGREAGTLAIMPTDLRSLASETGSPSQRLDEQGLWSQKRLSDEHCHPLPEVSAGAKH